MREIDIAGLAGKLKHVFPKFVGELQESWKVCKKLLDPSTKDASACIDNYVNLCDGSNNLAIYSFVLRAGDPSAKVGRSKGLPVTLPEQQVNSFKAFFDSDPHFINLRTFDGSSLLMQSIRHENTLLTQYLLDQKNIDITATNGMGENCLHALIDAMSKGHYKSAGDRPVVNLVNRLIKHEDLLVHKSPLRGTPCEYATDSFLEVLANILCEAEYRVTHCS